MLVCNRSNNNTGPNPSSTSLLRKVKSDSRRAKIKLLQYAKLEKEKLCETGKENFSFNRFSPRFFQLILFVVRVLNSQTPNIEKVANGCDDIVLDTFHQQFRTQNKSS